jgi:hypothetical protein
VIATTKQCICVSIIIIYILLGISSEVEDGLRKRNGNSHYDPKYLFVEIHPPYTGMKMLYDRMLKSRLEKYIYDPISNAAFSEDLTTSARLIFAYSAPAIRDIYFSLTGTKQL